MSRIFLGFISEGKKTQDALLNEVYYNEKQIILINQMVKNIAMYIAIHSG